MSETNDKPAPSGSVATADDMAAIGAEIRRRREEQGLSQQALAELAGTTQQTVDRIEGGRVSFSRFLKPILSALAWVEAEYKAIRADARAISTGGERATIPVYEWRDGHMAEAKHSLWAPDVLRGGKGYGVRVWAVVKSPSGDPVFQPGDVLFVDHGAPIRHNGWCLIVNKQDDTATRFGLYADPSAMPPQITRDQLAEWGFAVVDEEIETGHPVVAYYAASHANVLT